MGKKDIVLKKNRNGLYLIGIIVLLIIVIAILIIPGQKKQATIESNSKALLEILSKNESGKSGNTANRHKVANGVNGEIIFPVDSFDDKAQYYEYNGVKFFILKSNDGTIRAAFDACDVCFRSKRGYTQVGDFMQCNNCGQTFPEDQINVVLGGCNPSPLKREIIGTNLVINTDDILEGLRFF